MKTLHLLPLALVFVAATAGARPHIEDINADVLNRMTLSGVSASVDDYGNVHASLLGHVPGKPETPCVMVLDFPKDRDSIDIMVSGEDTKGKHVNPVMSFENRGSVDAYVSTPTHVEIKGKIRELFVTYFRYEFTLESNNDGSIKSVWLTNKMNPLVTIPDYLEGPGSYGTIGCEFPWVVNYPWELK